jgi:PhzF family phenazine biosynthesis protein
MTRARPFKQVDVFTAAPLFGNPVAVVLDGVGLSAEEMQRFANWTNLSETTFVLPGSMTGADYELRIFTPQFELKFAGHPTLGSAHAILEAGLVAPTAGKLVMQCKVGLVEIAVPEDWRSAGLSFRLPQHEMWPAPDPAALLSALRSGQYKRDPAVVNVGPHWVVAEMESAAQISALAPDLVALAAYDRAHSTTGITLFAQGGAGDITVRTFAPLDGIVEDPVCGSGNGAVAAFRLETGAVSIGTSYTASQGREIGRDGKIAIRFGEDGIHVGGNCVTAITGTVTL